MTKNSNLKEQLVEAYKEIRDIKREAEAKNTAFCLAIYFIAGLPLVAQIFIKPVFVGIANAVQCGQPTEKCLEQLFLRDE
jgi:hypothetical protein